MSDRTPQVEHEAELEARRKLQQASAVEQTLAVGFAGPPELRKGERGQFLGQFPEQVLKAVSQGALTGKTLPGKLVEALADSRCGHVYLLADVVPRAGALLRLVKAKGLPLTIVQSPEYRGGAAVVLTLADHGSVDKDDVWID